MKDYINLISESKIDKIIITEMTGRKILEKSMKGNSKIDVQSLKKGVFLIQIFTENEVETIKFLKD